MDKTKDKNILKEKLKTCMYVFIPLVIVSIIFYSWYYYVFLKYPNLGEENVASYKKLVQISNNHSTLKLEDVFNFEWDKAYILSNEDVTYERINKIINNDLGVLDQTENHLEIVFVLDNKLVDRFIYDAGFIRFFPLDCFVEKGALFQIWKSNGIIEFTSEKYSTF